MDCILAPTVDGSYQKLFGRARGGLFFHRLERQRFLFRHQASGLSLFHFLGERNQAEWLQHFLIERYNFCRDSTWVLKGQGELHSLLTRSGLTRTWMQRSWHYRFADDKTDVIPSTLEV